jgi:tRNA 2-selenouridine synthase
MSVQTVTAADTIADLGRYDAILDARSPAEFAEDHLPGAQNWPVLDDDERRVVGTLYKQQGPLEARKVGAAMVARNIATHVERAVQDKPRDWRPLVYCWRGGQRSGSLAWFLGQIGFRTTQLTGGYKGFRAALRDDLERLPATLQFTVLAGRTGSGKTRLLQSLAAEGAQVLDLEGLARHRGSILGALPDVPQPAQKRFDTLVWQALHGFDPARPVFVESESKRIGRLQVPDALLGRMRSDARVLRVQMNDDARVQLLLEDYGFFARDPERFCELLQALVELQGHATVERWQGMARSGRWAEVFGELMRRHYDPLYERSMRGHFPTIDAAEQVILDDGSEPALRRAARALCEPSAPEARPNRNAD